MPVPLDTIRVLTERVVVSFSNFPSTRKMAGKRRYGKSASGWAMAKRRKFYSRRNDFGFAGNGLPPISKISKKSGNTQIVKSNRSITLVSNTSYLNAGNFGALSFKLSDLPNYTDYSNLYDEYRIKAVRVDFVPATNGSAFTYNGVGVSELSIPALYTWIDTDDNTAPTTVASGQQFQTFKCHGLMSQMRTRWLVPEVSTALYSGAFTSYGQLKNQWIDNNSTSVVHFGLKYALINGTTNGGAFDAVATYYMEFRKAS